MARMADGSLFDRLEIQRGERWSLNFVAPGCRARWVPGEPVRVSIDHGKTWRRYAVRAHCMRDAYDDAVALAERLHGGE